MARAEIRIQWHGEAVDVDVDLTDENSTIDRLTELAMETTEWALVKIKNEQILNI